MNKNLESMSYTREYSKQLPKFKNAFITLVFDQMDKEKVVKFCENKEIEAASYLLSHEIVMEKDGFFKIELEVAYGYGVVSGIYTLGRDIGQLLNNNE